MHVALSFSLETTTKKVPLINNKQLQNPGFFLDKSILHLY